MQFYASPEQIMRDRSELARKGISRGRSVVVLTYAGGVLFVAENLSTALHKVSEIYDRIGFAAVGRYNEFEVLRSAGVRIADLRGYSFDRRDVTGRGLASWYTQTLGALFTDQSKPYEVELCIAQVGDAPGKDELYRITYDGSVSDEKGFIAMGGQAEAIATVVKQGHNGDLDLKAALALATKALSSVGGENGNPREILATQLEVAVLDRKKTGRTFRRITGNALTALLATEDPTPPDTAAGDESPAAESPTPPSEADAPVTETATSEVDSPPVERTEPTRDPSTEDSAE